MSRKFILLTESNGDIALVNVDLIECVRIPTEDDTDDLKNGYTWVEFESGSVITVKEKIPKIRSLIDEDDVL